ncbi:sigma-70 family RNA polymerase sigma factor [Actinacidiphila alni]|uniref:sigma-70 family RNA polymerase sigma factor n=1 Tax=Actinacidiphila alni TaxID=380248 RepID=UPI0015A6F8FC|nr:sigma-70 family RNA polymerase sigma factor [Actinacidiphila alni]
MAVADGDHKAFTDLYVTVLPVLLAVIRPRLSSRADVEDVAQDVMTELWTKAGDFRPDRGSALAWIVTIARRRTTDHLRRAAALRRHDLYAAGAHVTSSDRPVEDTVQERLDRGAMGRALAGLTDLQREAVQLAFYTGHTHERTAHLLGVPLGTAKSRIRSGLAGLRAELEDGA